MEVRVFDYEEKVELKLHNLKSRALKPQTIWVRTVDAKRLYNKLKDIFEPELEPCPQAK